jgi:hypothetical protein
MCLRGCEGVGYLCGLWFWTQFCYAKRRSMRWSYEESLILVNMLDLSQWIDAPSKQSTMVPRFILGRSNERPAWRRKLLYGILSHEHWILTYGATFVQYEFECAAAGLKLKFIDNYFSNHNQSVTFLLRKQESIVMLIRRLFPQSESKSVWNELSKDPPSWTL